MKLNKTRKIRDHQLQNRRRAYVYCFKFTRSSLSRPQWETTEVRWSNQYSKELSAIWRRSNSAYDEEHYKKYKKTYKKLLNRAKQHFTDRKISENKIRNVWNIVELGRKGEKDDELIKANDTIGFLFSVSYVFKTKKLVSLRRG